MKPVVNLFHVVAMATCLGSTLGDEQTGEARNCPLEGNTRRVEMRTLEELIRILDRCLRPSTSAGLEQFEFFTGVEDYRSYFKAVCHGLPDIRQCVAVESAQWNGCYNATMGKVFTIFFDLVDTSLQKGCVENGEGLAVFIEGYVRHTANYRASNPFVLECLIRTTARWVMVTRTNASLATKVWFLYRELQTFRECFEEYIDEASLVALFEELMNEMLDKMKCLSPEDESLVVCKSIDSDLIDRASACPFKTGVQGGAGLDNLLERRLHSCLVVQEPYSPQLSNLSTTEEFRTYFGNYCRRTGRVRHCLNETTMAASVCLQDSRYKNFKLLHHYLDTALDGGCSEGGKRLASMFYMAQILRNNTDQNEVFLKCLAGVMRKQRYDEPTSFNQVYQQLPTVRQCMVDVASDDTTYVDDVTAFVHYIMSKLKCINQQDGAIVLCKTIEQN